MSITAIKHVIEHSKTKGSARVLMIVLADMANDDGECWPGKANLAKKVNCIPRHIVRLVQDCERLGELRVIQSQNDGESNRYLITGLASEKRIKKARAVRPLSERKFPVGGVTGDTSDSNDTPPMSPVTLPPMSPVTPESTYKPKGNPDIAPASQIAPKPRPRNLYFDAIVEAFKFDVQHLTRTEASGIGKVANELKTAGYAPEDIAGIHAYCKAQKFDSFTPAALTKHAGAWRAKESSRVVKMPSVAMERPAEPTPEELAESRRLFKEAREARRVSQ